MDSSWIKRQVISVKNKGTALDYDMDTLVLKIIYYSKVYKLVNLDQTISFYENISQTLIGKNKVVL